MASGIGLRRFYSSEFLKYLLFAICLFPLHLSAQKFLNGDFEGTYWQTSNKINMPNSTFNNLMPYCHGFGYDGNLDILSNYYSDPQSGKWYIALTGNGTDRVALELDEPLIKGNTYNITFYDRVNTILVTRANYCQVGVSSEKDSMGVIVYKTPTLPINEGWTERNFSFKAPLTGKYITLELLGGGNTHWIMVDNFHFNCPPLMLRDTTLCFGESIILNTKSEGATYLWQDSSTNAEFLVTKPGKYWVKKTANECTVIDSATINYKPEIIFNLGNDTAICEGESLLLKPILQNATFTWYDNSTDSTYIVKFPGKYWVKATVNGCSVLDTISVVFNPKPEIDLGNDTSLCFNEALKLDATSPFANYLWHDGSTSPEYYVTKPGFYAVKVTRENCSVTDSIEIKYKPAIDLNLGNDTFLCLGKSFSLNAGFTNAKYLWNDGSVKSFIEINKPGKYWVKVFKDGCEESDTILVYTKDEALCNCRLYVPNSFTPNNDSTNNVFRTFYVCEFDWYNLTIYNRWGEKLFMTNDPEKYWDGKYGNDFCAEGIYFYKLYYRFKGNYKPVQLTGTLQLIR